MTSLTMTAATRLQRSLAVWVGAAALIVLPLLLLDLISEPNELIFAGVLVAAVGIPYEIATRVPGRLTYWAGAGLALATALSLVLMNGAVGIIGSEDNPHNRIFIAGIAVAAAGAVTARFQAKGLALAMFAAALTHVGIFVFAWAAGYGFTGPISVFFSAMWLFAGRLFRRAAAERTARA